MSATLNGDGTVAKDGGTATDLIGGLAKTWSVLNMATATLGASQNVTSVTDNGVGNFDVNLTNPFASANYTKTGGGNPYAEQGAASIAGTYYLMAYTSGVALNDYSYVTNSCDGDLA